MSEFYKTTLVIWSKEDPKDFSLEDLMKQYVSYRSSRKSVDPYYDPHCDYSDYFESEQGNS